MKSFEEVTHPEMVEILAKPGQAILDTMTPVKAHLWHMAPCILGELIEFNLAVENSDHKNVIEEAGDLEFYLAGVFIVEGINYTEDPEFDYESVTFDFYAEQLFDVIKKYVIYNDPDVTLDQIAIAASNARRALNCEYMQYCELNSMTMEFLNAELAQTGNKKKLSKRYHKLAYSDEQAQNRADK